VGGPARRVRDVLDARRMLLESELMSARATAEQHQMLAEMLLWTGLGKPRSPDATRNRAVAASYHDKKP